MKTAQHAPGTFCWAELHTSDAAGAKQFYTGLFGWQPRDVPIGNEMVYTMLEQDGATIGALFQEDQPGIPPHWNLYISVTSADESAAKAKDLGGTVIGVFDVMTHGRMVALQDPTGAHVCLWQPGDHPGFGVVGEPGSFCWAELNTRDTDAAAKFYTALLGWTVKPNPEYSEFQNDGKSIAGMMTIKPEWGPDVPPHWLTYFYVARCDDAVRRATELGARVLVPATDIPGVGRFAVLQDPQHAVFGIVD